MTSQGAALPPGSACTSVTGHLAAAAQPRDNPEDSWHHALRHQDISRRETAFHRPSPLQGPGAFRPGSIIHDFMLEEGLLDASQAPSTSGIGSLQPSFAVSAGPAASSQNLSLEADDDFLAGLTFTLPPFQMPHAGLPDVEGGFAGLPVHAAARDFESLPAELPSHVVDRLLRQDPPGSAAPVLMDSIKCSEGLVALSKPLVRTLSAPAFADLDELLMGPSAPSLPSQMPLHPPPQRPRGPPSPRKHLLMDPSELRAYAATADIKSLHNVYLTPQHKRKGKGGRQPAGDPRLDPNMDPKRAKRILNNRLSAARSKAKQRTAQDGVSKKVEGLQQQRNKLRQELRSLKASCSEQAASNKQLEQQLQLARHQQQQEPLEASQQLHVARPHHLQEHEAHREASQQLHILPAGPPPSVFAGHHMAGDHGLQAYLGSHAQWPVSAALDPASGLGGKASRLQETPSHLQLLRDLGLPVTMSSEQLALNLSGSLAAQSQGHFPFTSSMSSEQLVHLYPSGPLKGSL